MGLCASNANGGAAQLDTLAVKKALETKNILGAVTAEHKTIDDAIEQDGKSNGLTSESPAGERIEKAIQNVVTAAYRKEIADDIFASTKSTDRAAFDAFLKTEIDSVVEEIRKNGLVIDQLAAGDDEENKLEEVLGGAEVTAGLVITPAQKEELWGFYDKDGNGELDMEEVTTVMKHLIRYRAKHATKRERRSVELRAMIMTPFRNTDFPPEQMATMLFNSMDKNHDGKIEKEEFVERFSVTPEACQVS